MNCFVMNCSIQHYYARNSPVVVAVVVAVVVVDCDAGIPKNCSVMNCSIQHY